MLHCMTDLLWLLLSTILVLLIETYRERTRTLDWYFALYTCLCIIIIIFVQSLLMHLHSDQVPDAPVARDSLGVCTLH